MDTKAIKKVTGGNQDGVRDERNEIWRRIRLIPYDRAFHSAPAFPNPFDNNETNKNLK